MPETVKLSLVGRQRDETGEESITKTSANAEYYEKNGSIYLLYEEIQEETGAAVKNTLKLKGSVLELTRRGAVDTHMIFEAGRMHPSDYATPYGRLKIGVRTRSLEVSSGRELMKIKAEYSLMTDDFPFSDCTLVITIEKPGRTEYVP